MASRRISKQQMREDQFRDFLSEFYFGTLGHMEKHWQAYGLGLVAAVLALAGGYYLWSIQNAKAAKASYLLGQVMDAYSAPVDPATKPVNNQLSFATDALRTQAFDARLAALKKSSGRGAAGAYAAYYTALDQARGGKLTEAEATLGPLVKNSDLAPLALFLRARLYEAGGQNADAESDLKTLAAMNTDRFPKGEGWWLLGQFYEKRGQKDKAIEAYEKARKAAEVVPSEAAPASPAQAAASQEDPVAKRAKDKLEALKGGA